MNAPCATATARYTPFKRLENARLSGTAHRHRAFFTPGIRPGFGQSVSKLGIGGMQRPQGVALHLVAVFQTRQFSDLRPVPCEPVETADMALVAQNPCPKNA